MILILKPNVDKTSREYRSLIARVNNLPGISAREHDEQGGLVTLTEVYLIGDTSGLDTADMESLPLVERVVRVSREYRVLGRHDNDTRENGFLYNGLRFSQNSLHVFAGLCAVDNRRHVEEMMRALKDHGQMCARMGAYKPRTSPYSFQGHGAGCLPYVFELAGKYGIRVIAMEVTHDGHIGEIRQALADTESPTGVMLQVGTRNTQNFELLKALGRQSDFPVLFKRGFGITLNESLNAAEYLASEGNSRVIFCLRGVKTNMGDPHRNLVDFTHVPTVKRLTRMPVAIDPSHSVGTLVRSADEIPDVFHAAAQGIIAGANLVLADFHPRPEEALVDGAQALTPKQLDWFLGDIAVAREAYEKRRHLREARAAEANT